MAEGFKVADAYVDLHIKDGTKADKDRIGRETEQWADREGNKSGHRFGGAFARGLLSGFKAAFGAVIKTAMISALVGVVGAAVAALAGYIVQLTSVLYGLVAVIGQAMGAFLLLPGVIFTVISAVAGLKLAFSGMGAALKAGLTGDMAAFNQALQKMAPNAQAVARTIVGLKPVFDSFKKSLQDRVFGGVAPMLRDLAKIYMPILNKGFSGPGGVGDGLNRILLQIGAYFKQPQTQVDMSTLFGRAGQVLIQISRAIVPALNLLRDLAVVATDVLSNLSHLMVPMIQGWADMIHEMRETGRLQELIYNSLDAIKMLGHLLADMWHIITGIARAAGRSGGLFTFFQRLSDWINSVQGQGALVQLFNALKLAADALTPALYTLGRVLGDLLSGLAVTMVKIGPTLDLLIAVLGQELQRILPSLTPLLITLGQVLIHAIPALGKFIVLALDLVNALGPAAIVVLEALTPALEALRLVAPLVGDALGKILLVVAPLIKALGPVLAVLLARIATELSVVAQALAPTIELFGELIASIATETLQYLVDSGLFTTIANAIGQIAQATRPLIPLLVRLVRDGVQKLLGAFERYRPEIEQLMPQLVDAFIELSHAGLQLWIAFAPLIPAIFELATNFITQLLPAMIQMTPAFVEIVKGFTAILISLTTKDDTGHSLIDYLVLFATWLIRIAADGAGPMAWSITNIMIPALNLLLIAFNFLIGGIEFVNKRLRDLAGLPNRIREGVRNFPNLLFQAGRDLIQGLINGIQSMASRLWGVVTGIGDGIKSVFGSALEFGSPSKVFIRYGQGTVDSYIMGVQSRMGRLAEVMGGLVASLPQQMRTVQNELAGGRGMPPLYVMVQIGDKTVKDMLTAEITDNPLAVARAAKEGDRRLAYVDPVRRRVGVKR